ncbi:hypothetical protein ACH47C_25690 [Streptomyces rishiriensis]
MFFQDWARDIVAACEEFDAGELETVNRFLAVMTEAQRRATARLTG